MIEFRVKMTLNLDDGPREYTRVVMAHNGPAAALAASRQLRSEGITNCTFTAVTTQPESIARSLDVFFTPTGGRS